MVEIKSLINKVAGGESLSRDEARNAFDVVMSGKATPSQMGGLLMALRVRGETVEEITGAVNTMRDRMTPVSAPDEAIDIVGTGGDASGTYNISTCAAIVAAGCGIKVAKHGNRALSSKSGAADVLMALGVKIEVTPEKVTECIDKAGVGFMFAPAHHAAMRFVGPTRVELGTRTIFNMLGPLSNPASTKRQVIGVFARDWLEPFARVLKNLGAETVWVTHGEGGLDEITSTGKTEVAELRNGEISTFEITPEDAGLPRGALEELKGGDSNFNAEAIRNVLAGANSTYRDTVLMTVACALVVAAKVTGLKDGVAVAAEAVDNGSASAVLDKLVEVSNS